MKYRKNSAPEPTPQNAKTRAASMGQVHLHFMLAAHYYGLPTIRVQAPSQLTPQAVEQEFNVFVLSMPSPEGTNPLAFWEVSVVPCEHIFSSSNETNVKKCNCIAPVLMEALQMLKFWLKKDCLNFTQGWITPQKDMVFDDNDDDLLMQLFLTMDTSGLDDVLSAIARAEGNNVCGVTSIF
ncbi:hypothetical protein JVU11DRAFT_10603 [Chiua virens]|nr:hypothetical protein JVU11DRAFT_10603 [Chiua virens]